MKNVLNFKWLVLLMTLAVFAINDAKADVNDVSISMTISNDSVTTNSLTEPKALGCHALFEEKVKEYTFEFAVLASTLAAILTLLLFFGILRPKIKIFPQIALSKADNDTVFVQILFTNKGVFPCNDLRIFIKGKVKDRNGDFTLKPLNKVPFSVLTLKGKWYNSGQSDYCLVLNIKKDAIPSMLSVSVMSQHAVSSIVTSVESVFGPNDYINGKFIQGLLIPEGCNYKETIMRENSQTLRCILLGFAIIYILGIAWLFATLLSLNIKLLIAIGVFVLATITIIIWQLIVQTKANSVNNSKNIHISSNTHVIEIHNHMETSTPSAPHEAEEVPYEEVVEKGEEKDTPKHLK